MSHQTQSAGQVWACQRPECNVNARGGDRRIRAFCPHEWAAWEAQRARILAANERRAVDAE
jgi:hypothetical protein